MIGDGICNALECNRFDAFTLDEKGNHVLLTEADAPISLDVGDCSAAMARLITKAQMILEVKPFSRQSRDNAIKILHDAQNYHEPLQQSAVQANASLLCSEDPPALPAIQCSEYFRQKQFYDIAGFLLDHNLELNRPSKTLVIEGATSWDAWKVRAPAATFSTIYVLFFSPILLLLYYYRAIFPFVYYPHLPFSRTHARTHVRTLYVPPVYPGNSL